MAHQEVPGNQVLWDHPARAGLQVRTLYIIMKVRVYSSFIHRYFFVFQVKTGLQARQEHPESTALMAHQVRSVYQVIIRHKYNFNCGNNGQRFLMNFNCSKRGLIIGTISSMKIIVYDPFIHLKFTYLTCR